MCNITSNQQEALSTQTWTCLSGKRWNWCPLDDFGSHIIKRSVDVSNRVFHSPQKHFCKEMKGIAMNVKTMHWRKSNKSMKLFIIFKFQHGVKDGFKERFVWPFDNTVYFMGMMWKGETQTCTNFQILVHKSHRPNL